jgi:hypothetical protein
MTTRILLISAVLMMFGIVFIDKFRKPVEVIQIEPYELVLLQGGKVIWREKK